MRTYRKRAAYPDEWICRQYLEAARKTEAVRILADLNAVGPDTIRGILKANGIDVSESIKKPKWAERVFYREILTGRLCHATEAARALGLERDRFVQYLDRHDRLEYGGQIWVRATEKL